MMLVILLSLPLVLLIKVPKRARAIGAPAHPPSRAAAVAED
jgi:hypothetical protein